ncbi:MAG: GNAT family N-acetyltransferase [Geminicoccaceae bacterium]
MTFVTVRTDALRTAPLREEHAEDAVRLSAEASWNQTADDWRVMIRYGQTWGRFTQSGQLVATTLLLPYAERLAWLAMVLVTERYRHQGIASALMSQALQRCDELGLSAGLDATPDGRRVYRPHGFQDLFGLQRLQCARPRHRAVEVGGVSLRDLGAIDARRVIDLDAEVFGVPRAAVVGYLQNAAPQRAVVAKSAGRLVGFVLARPGRRALHLGPITANRAEIAQALVSRALAGVKGPIVIDVPDAQDRFQAWLTSVGFLPVRPFTRMLRGRAELGDPKRTFAVAGPELG